MSASGIRLFLQTVRLILTVGIFFIFSHFFISSASASVSSYLVNDAFVALDHPFATGVGYVWYHKNIVINYTGGKVFLSRNDDGTGEMTVGDAIQVTINSKSFLFRSSQSCTSFNKLQPVDITYLLSPGSNNILVKYSEWCGNGDRPIDQAYLVYKDQLEYGITPFLRLPWDYQAKGLSFSDASLGMSSYFDHEYPLLSLSSLNEPLVASSSVILFKDILRVDKPYTQHDGYDWAKKAKANYGDPVLAAAGGWAEYINTCSACGNAVVIDHGNGYQTRYYHMQKSDLITDTPGQKIQVTAGQKIGKVGATGNVWPKDPENPAAGAHIHFMVVQDKNNDGNFQDNIPDGLTDPFGWQAVEPDPWENYEFSLFGQAKKGNKSTYLWQDGVATTKTTIPKTGGSIIINGHKVTFPSGYLKDQGIVEVKATPIQSATTVIRGLSSGLEITVIDIFGTTVKVLPTPITLIWDFSKSDLSNTDTSTLSLYSSNDGVTWTKETTQIDLPNKKATAQINHLTEFALMGELKDTIAPQTALSIITNTGNYLELVSHDNENGIGVEYTMYKINDNEWEQYLSPVLLQGAGTYTIQYYSADLGENIEEVKSETIALDSTPPISQIQIAGVEGQDNWYRSDIVFTLSAQDNVSGSGIKETKYKIDQGEWTIYTNGVTISNEGDHTIEYYSEDLAGNIETVQDITFHIDKTAPEIEISLHPTNLSLQVEGRDQAGDPIITESSLGSYKKQFIVKDTAGNTLTTIGQKVDSSLLPTMTIESLQYNTDPIVILEKNVLLNTIIKNLKTKNLVSIAQVFTQKDKNVLGSLYTVSDNKTRIYTYDRSNKQLLKEILLDKRLLQLYTDRGTLKYRY